MSFKKPSKNARRKLEVPVEAAMLCKKRTKEHSGFQETGAKSDEFQQDSKDKASMHRGGS